MTQLDQYFTAAGPGRAEIKVKASRFIGEVFPVDSETEAEARLAEVRKREFDARHHCFAWVLGLPGPVVHRTRASDDGEPSGTAGRPMLQVLEARQLTQTMVVVTRYFGGTLLGTGGLVRAYSEAAKLALDAAGTLTHFIEVRFRLLLPFGYYNQVQSELARLGARVESSQFEESVSLLVAIRASKAQILPQAIVACSQGRAKVQPEEL